MAQLNFESATGVIVPATSDIRADLVEKIQNAFQTSPNDPVLNCEPSSPMGQVVDLIVAEIEAKNAELVFLANMANPNSATGKFLDALASLYGIDRKISEPTIVTARITGLKGTVVPFGAIVEDASGNQFRHIASGGARIGNNGTAVTTFASVEHGAIEVPAGALSKIITVVAGWDGVTNPTAGILGRDEETDSELRTRMAESYAINATGYVSAVQSNLASLDGVIDVKVLENYTNASVAQYGISVGAHSIAVCIVGGDDTAIAQTIYRRKDAGCGTTGNYSVTYNDEETGNVFTYKIVRPASATLSIQIEVFDSLAADSIAAIKTAIVSDVLGLGANDRIGMAETVYASRFYPVVQAVTNAPIKQITVAFNGGTASQYVAIPADKIPAITADDVTITVVSA